MRSAPVPANVHRGATEADACGCAIVCVWVAMATR